MSRDEALVIATVHTDRRVRKTILQETPNIQTTRGGLSTAPRQDKGFRLLLVRL